MRKPSTFRGLLTTILFSGILIFAALVMYVSLSTFHREQEYIEKYTHSMMKALILDLEVKIASTESVLQSQSHMDKIAPSDSLQFYDEMEEFLADNNFVHNVGIDFWNEFEDDNPDAFSVTYFAARDSSVGGIYHGSVVVYNRDVRPEEMDCYMEADATGMPCWSQPYYDSQFTGRYMTTCYQKCEPDGVMLSADVRISELLSNIDSLQFYADSRMFIIDEQQNAYTLLHDSDGSIQMVQVELDDIRSDNYIKITAHYDSLNIDIVNLVPKGQIYTFLWSRAFIALIVFIIGLAMLAILVHRSFLKAQSDLEASVKKASEEEIALKSIENELGIAFRIQRGMLTSPDRGAHIVPDEGRAADIMARIIPAREVGGDLYEYRLEGHNLVFCVGDVSGKGIPASVVMTICTALFHSYVSENDAPDPSDLLSYLNAQMCRHNPDMMFVTMWAGVLDLRSGELKYSSAGHNQPVILRDGAEFLDKWQGTPLGLFDDSVYRTLNCTLDPGDSILVYTDGIPEAEAAGNVLFGDRRLLEACRSCISRSPQVICDTVLGAVRAHADGCPQSDDITLLCVTYDSRLAQIHTIDDVIALHTLSEECDCGMRTPLVLEELAVNAFTYGAAGFVTAEFAASSGSFRLIDDGAPFDPTAYRPSVADDDEMQIGGRGISLVRKICSEFTYERIGAYNVTTLKVDEI